MITFKRIYRTFLFFYRYNPGKLLLLFCITLFMGFNQGASIAMLIPILNQLNTENQPQHENKFLAILSKIGIEPSIGSILLIVLILILVSSILTFINSRIQSKYEQGFIYYIRHELFKRIIGCDWLTINSMSKHSHIQILSNEVPKMTVYYYSKLRFITGLIIIAAHITVSFLISAQFTLMVIFIGVLFFVLLRKFLSEAVVLGERQLNSYRRMLKDIDDFWIMIKQAKIHHTESFYFNRFNSSILQTKEIQNRQSIRRAKSQLVYSIAGIIAVICIVFCSYYIQHLPLATIIILIMLFARIFPLFVTANNDLNLLLSNLNSAELTIKTYNDLPETDLADKEEPDMMFDGDITLSNISFGYNNSNTIISNLSVVFRKNKITGILGPSGTGKTTLIDLISGLITPDQGTISIGESILTPDNKRSWQKVIGYLPQDPYFVDGTIRDNLVWDSNQPYSDQEIYDTLESVSALDFINQEPEKIYTSIANYGYHFSGGERQRLALARVLLRKPTYLILDEATSGLDSENELQIMNTLVKIKDSVTIIIVTHNKQIEQFFDSTYRFD